MAHHDPTSKEAELVLAYVHSMPVSYRASFDEDAIRAHAAVVQRRAGQGTRVERWRDLAGGVAAICIVADDHPGLLSRISAALVAHDVDVVSAYAYCRRTADGGREAVDFLWIRRRGGPSRAVVDVRDADVAAIGEMVDALARGEAAFEPRARPPRPSGRALRQDTRVRFEPPSSDGATVLTIEAVDRPGLLLAVTRSLFRAGLQIVGLRATSERGRAIDRFEVVELDGKPLDNARLLALQIAILSAIEARNHDEPSGEPATPPR